MRKIKEEGVEEKVLKLLKDANMPVSVDFIAHNLGISWNTARSLLLEMALKGVIKAKKTSKSWIFWKQVTRTTKSAPRGSKRN